jgi:PAS domain S-box-containing protein
MQKVLIVGGGKSGVAILRILVVIDQVEIIGVVTDRPDDSILVEAKKEGIPTGSDPIPFLERKPDLILDATDQLAMRNFLQRHKPKHTILLSGSLIELIAYLIEENEHLFHTLRQRQLELEAIIQSTHDGMVAVNRKGEITLLNRSAEKLLGVTEKEALGKDIREIVPTSRLGLVLENGQPQLNQQQEIPSGRVVLTNRVPVKDQMGEVIGAVSVFRDVSELLQLTEQLANLKDMKNLLQAIINSSDEAISVVDAEGKGILINPAYTRLTGLQESEVIGKPAHVDISEGESMHMKVLKTRRPVRGVQMKVGPHRREVVVNVAPIIIKGELKGSVGIVHDTSEIKQLYRELEKAQRMIRKLEATYTFDDIIGESEEMKIAIGIAKQAANTRATVLLRGESGTGKELFAHAIHNASSRRYNQFVRVNCAALSETLLESELFGYEEGAFTGARRGGKKGLFEEANGGTIFLDEIGELKPSTQAKLLRTLQEKEVTRVGGTKPISIDVRIIAATNLFLEKAIEEKRFREDLFYRLNVVPIHIPPLRLRKQDLYPLVVYLIKKLNLEYGRSVRDITEDALALLSQYSWPGNVRELENVLGRAMIHMSFQEKVIKRTHLSIPISTEIAEQESTDVNRPLREILAEVEKEHIRKVYQACQKNKMEAARRLGISIRSLYYKLERYQLL